MCKRLEQATYQRGNSNGHKTYERCSTSLVIRKMQNKPSVRYLYTHSTWIIKLLPERLYQVILPKRVPFHFMLANFEYSYYLIYQINEPKKKKFTKSMNQSDNCFNLQFWNFIDFIIFMYILARPHIFFIWDLSHTVSTIGCPLWQTELVPSFLTKKVHIVFKASMYSVQNTSS